MKPTQPSSSPIELHGIGVSPGAIIGTAHLLSSVAREIPERDLSEEEIPGEVLRLQEALMRTCQQITEIQRRMTDAIGAEDAGIFDAHLLMAEDHSFIEKILVGLRERKKNVETIIQEVATGYAEAFARIDDDYVRERVADLHDVTHRILQNLERRMDDDDGEMAEGSIIVARDLSPSETATLDRSRVVAFVTDMGSHTSHTAITARSLEIPAVVGLGNISLRAKHGDPILVDGTRGVVIVRPTPEQRVHYGHLTEAREEIKKRLGSLINSPSTTRDGRPIRIEANIESPDNVEAVRKYGLTGVGLFRSEYLYLTRADLPSEDEQAAVYEETVRALTPGPVIIRTLDVGGDKFATQFDLPAELNPFLGCRGIRFCLSQPDLFLTQLRAILRASALGDVKIMFPMISNADEVILALQFLEQAKDQLRESGHKFNPDIEVGVMIEVPAAAISASLIAPHVDFFSIGTNDLIQYAFAVDRLNERVAELYQPTHPAILQLIAQTVEAGHAGGCWVGVCGQMAGNPILSPLLVGLGVDELSVSPPAAPLVKWALRGASYAECVALAESALKASSAADALEKCRRLASDIAPEIIELLE